MPSDLKLDEYQKLARATAMYPSESGLSYCALGLCGESGEVADKLKKVIRDEGGKLSEGKSVEVAKELGDVLWYIANLSAELGYTLAQVGEMNIEKLRSRYERGVLGGEGDNR
jgi:NTP pyrophosphatase (non-canonical NTP hydrolase)